MKFRMSLICNFAHGYFICQFLKHLTENVSGFPVLSPLLLCVIWYVSLIFTNIHHFLLLVPVCNGAIFKLAFLSLRWLVAGLSLWRLVFDTRPVYLFSLDKVAALSLSTFVFLCQYHSANALFSFVYVSVMLHNLSI
jgi:hypothetical protein